MTQKTPESPAGVMIFPTANNSFNICEAKKTFQLDGVSLNASVYCNIADMEAMPSPTGD
jgi:hypothetical protein